MTFICFLLSLWTHLIFISLIMCLSMSLTLLCGWVYYYDAYFHFSQSLLVVSLCFFSYLCFLALMLCFLIKWGSYDSMFVHSILKYKNYNWCTNLGELSYSILNWYIFYIIIISSIGLILFKLISFIPFGISWVNRASCVLIDIYFAQMTCWIFWLLASFVDALSYLSFVFKLVI